MNSPHKTANILGATGLVGSNLLTLLLEDDRYKKVRIFVRRSVGIAHAKLEEHIVDFEEPWSWHHSLTGDDLFSCMGTTIKNAGNKEAQYKVDVTYPLEAAKAAAHQGVKNYALISSSGADADSFFFYNRIKGELDQEVKKLSFSKIRIIRPGILEGNRKEKRLGESIGISAMGTMARLAPFLKKYRPYPAETVARAMVNGLNSEELANYKVYELEEVFKLAGYPFV